MQSRVQAVLDEIRPALLAHKGDAHIESIEDGVVRLALTGTCKGCPMSVVTFGFSLRALLREKVPEVAEVTWDGMEELFEDEAQA